MIPTTSARRFPAVLALAIAAALTLPSNRAQAQAPAPASAPAATSFNALLDAQTMAAINADPELRTMLGISGDAAGDLSGQLTDVSLARREINRRFLVDNLAQIRAWKGTPLDPQQRLSDGSATDWRAGSTRPRSI